MSTSRTRDLIRRHVEASFYAEAKGEKAKIRELRKRLEKENDPAEISALINAIDAMEGYVSKGKEAREKRKKDKAEKAKSVADEKFPSDKTTKPAEASPAPSTVVELEAAPTPYKCSDCMEEHTGPCPKKSDDNFFGEMGMNADERIQFERARTPCDACPHMASDHNFAAGANYGCQRCAAEGGPCANGYPGYAGESDAAEHEAAANPYNSICPECGTPATGTERCSDPMMSCASGHTWKRSSAPRKDEGEKPPVSDTCDDCGADIGACGCKNMAFAESSLVEQMAQAVYARPLEDLTWDEIYALQQALKDSLPHQASADDSSGPGGGAGSNTRDPNNGDPTRSW